MYPTFTAQRASVCDSPDTVLIRRNQPTDNLQSIPAHSKDIIRQQLTAITVQPKTPEVKASQSFSARIHNASNPQSIMQIFPGPVHAQPPNTFQNTKQDPHAIMTLVRARHTLNCMHYHYRLLHWKRQAVNRTVLVFLTAHAEHIHDELDK